MPPELRHLVKPDARGIQPRLTGRDASCAARRVGPRELEVPPPQEGTHVTGRKDAKRDVLSAAGILEARRRERPHMARAGTRAPWAG